MPYKLKISLSNLIDKRMNERRKEGRKLKVRRAGRKE